MNLLMDENIIKAQDACRESAYVTEALTKAGDPVWVGSDLIQEIP